MLDISGAITSAFLGVFSVLFGLFFNVAGTITGAILGIAVLFFNWVSSPNFISLSYTNPAGNEFIRVGWTLTRDLTNIIFVIALVAIGLGTALRRSDYQMQKTLPTLIIIALLINFTPVITGLIIDASNIAMGFFINPEGSSAGQIIWQKATSQWSNISALVGGAQFWNPTKSGGALAAATGSLFLVFFNLIAAIVYFLYGFIFILRYVVIWLLVILSPFAFASYILPATRAYFTQWWKAFIGWSLLGVIAGFFIYLAEHLAKIINTSEFIKTSLQNSSQTPGFALIMNNTLPYLLPIILLFIGFVASISAAPQGAQSILKAGQKGMTVAGKTFGKIYAKKTWGATKGAARGVARAIPGVPPLRAGLEAWRIQRGLGSGVKKSLGAAAERAGAAIRLETGWRTRAAAKAAPGKVGTAALSASKGLLSALRDSAKAGAMVGFGIKAKKKGLRKKPCEACGYGSRPGETIGANAERCPKCNNVF